MIDISDIIGILAILSSTVLGLLVWFKWPTEKRNTETDTVYKALQASNLSLDQFVELMEQLKQSRQNYDKVNGLLEQMGTDFEHCKRVLMDLWNGIGILLNQLKEKGIPPKWEPERLPDILIEPTKKPAD